MSESIDAISASSHAQLKSGAQNAIKEETKKKLEALGIDPNSVKTEAEAQQKIKEAEAAQANAQVQGTQNINFSHPMGEVIEDAKELAAKIGLRIGNVDNVEKLLNDIDKKIKEFEEEVKNDKDDERKKMVAGVRGVYEQIHTEYEKSIEEQKKITNNLDMIATYNMIRS